MKKTILFIIFLSFFNMFYSQNILEAIVVDSETLVPIEFVDVYSYTDYTSTNADGRFLITSKRDSLNFRRLGYNKIRTTFEKLKSTDTIFLIKKEESLDEVVLKNAKDYLKDVFLNVKDNYPFKPYKEKFFIRVVLKKDGEIVKLQDLYGKLERQSLFGNQKIKKNYKVELLNMRKAGIDEKIYDAVFFSFNQFLNEITTISYNPEFFSFKRTLLEDTDYFRLNFFSKKKDERKLTEGYYIVNSESNAIDEFYSTYSIKDGEYKNKFGIIKYRTTFYERFISFKKNKKTKKYYVDKFKINATLELLLKKSTTPIIFDYSYIMLTEDNFGNFEVDKNVSSKKDMFKLKHPYNEEFWIHQKTLLLTEEMLKFLDGIENSEYKIKTNLN